MDIKKIIQQEIGKVLNENFEQSEVPRILQGPRGFVLGMASKGGAGQMFPRSIESPWFSSEEEVCRFYGKWNPSMATMQESIMAESNDIKIVGDPEQMCTVNTGMMEDNYPAGAANDPDAPYNQNSSRREGERAKEIKFEVVWHAHNSGVALVKDKAGKLYAFNTEMVDSDDYEPYAGRSEKFIGYDEDGMPDVEHGDWELDKDVIEQYINDNLDKVKVGKGIDDWESGNYQASTIDDEVKADLEGLAKYIGDTRAKQELLGILGGINEIAKKIVDTEDTMDTPTGALFTISMAEGDYGVVEDTVISDYEETKLIALEKSREGYGVHVNAVMRRGDITFYISDWYDSSETVATYESGEVRLEEEFEDEESVMEWIQDHSDDEY